LFLPGCPNTTIDDRGSAAEQARLGQAGDQLRRHLADFNHVRLAGD